MLLPNQVLVATSDPRLIVLSVLIAIIGSYAALDISEQIAIAQDKASRWWLIGSGLTLGLTVWAMHFTAILSHKLPIPVGYDFKIVLASMLLTILASGIGFFSLLVSRYCIGCHYQPPVFLLAVALLECILSPCHRCNWRRKPFMIGS